jgi:hypothetical protein
MYVRETQMSVRSLSTKLRKSFATIIGATLVAASLVATAPANATAELITDHAPTIAAQVLNCTGPGGAGVGGDTEFYHYDLGTSATADFTLGTNCDHFDLYDQGNSAGIQTADFDLFGADGVKIATYNAASPNWVTNAGVTYLRVQVQPGQTVRVHSPRTPSDAFQIDIEYINLWVQNVSDNDPMTDDVRQGRVDITIPRGQDRANMFPTVDSYRSSQYMLTGIPSWGVGTFVSSYTAYTGEANQGTYTYKLESCNYQGAGTAYLMVDGAVQISRPATPNVNYGRYVFTLTGLTAGVHTVKVRLSCTVPVTLGNSPMYQSTPVYVESEPMQVTVQDFLASTPTFAIAGGTTNATAGGFFGLNSDASAAPVDGFNAILSYQWYKDGVAIDGATYSNYTDYSVSLSDAGDYTVVVTNTMNGSTVSATSPTYTLTVSPFQLYTDLREPTSPSTNSEVSIGMGSFANEQNLTKTPRWYSCTNEITTVLNGSVSNPIPNDCTALSVSNVTTDTNINQTRYAVQSGDVGKRLLVIIEVTDGSATRYYRTKTSEAVASGGGGGGCGNQCMMPTIAISMAQSGKDLVPLGTKTSPMFTSLVRVDFVLATQTPTVISVPKNKLVTKGNIVYVKVPKVDLSLFAVGQTALTGAMNLVMPGQTPGSISSSSYGNVKFVKQQVVPTVTLDLGDPAVFGDADRSFANVTMVGNSYIASMSSPVSKTPKVCTIVYPPMMGPRLHIVSAGTCKVEYTGGGTSGLKSVTAKDELVIRGLQLVITVDQTARNITLARGVNLGASVNSAGAILDYTSSNEDVCVVDGSGFVTGVSVGACTISINAPAGPSLIAAVQQQVVVNVTDDGSDLPESADAVVDQSPANVPNDPKAFSQAGDLLLSWDKATGKLTPRALGVYTGHIKATLTFQKNGQSYACEVVFGQTTKMAVPARPTNPSKMAAYLKAKKAANALKTFNGASFCTDKNKLTGTTFSTLVKGAKTSQEKSAEAAALAVLKAGGMTNIVITVKRWRANPVTLTNKTAANKTISATTRTTTLTLP